MQAALARHRRLASGAPLSVLAARCDAGDGGVSPPRADGGSCTPRELACLSAVGNVKRVHKQYDDAYDALDHFDRPDIWLAAWAARQPRVLEITQLREPGSWVRSMWRRNWHALGAAAAAGADADAAAGPGRRASAALARGELDATDDASAPAFVAFEERCAETHAAVRSRRTAPDARLALPRVARAQSRSP